MAENRHEAIETLEYLRSIVTASRSGQVSRSAGYAFLAAGVLYGLQALTIWGQQAGVLPASSLLSMAVSIVATGGFLATLVLMLRKERRDRTDRSDAARAISGFFAGAGLANLALIVIFVVAAWRVQDWGVWALYPAVLCALQGAAWYAAAVINRRAWFGAVALGWYLTGVALGLLAGSSAYLLVLGFALIVLMGAPGAYFVWRAPRS